MGFDTSELVQESFEAARRKLAPIDNAISQSNHEVLRSYELSRRGTESISAREFGDVELFIVKVASNDVSRQIMDSYTTKDLPIQVIFPECNQGISKIETEQLRETF